MTHTVYEARQLRLAAHEAKVATQLGNQGTASPELRRGVEVIRAGALGTVTEVHVWTNRPVWPQAPKIMARPDHEDPVPPTIHWDEWIGPAPMRPVCSARTARALATYHPFNWRGWWDFGTGALGDMGCHTANMPFMALQAGLSHQRDRRVRRPERPRPIRAGPPSTTSSPPAASCRRSS